MRKSVTVGLIGSAVAGSTDGGTSLDESGGFPVWTVTIEQYGPAA
jgi:hypothetical protein